MHIHGYMNRKRYDFFYNIKENKPTYYIIIMALLVIKVSEQMLCETE